MKTLFFILSLYIIRILSEIEKLATKIWPKAGSLVWRLRSKIWYVLLSKYGKKRGMLFMNYGYATLNSQEKRTKLEDIDEPDRHNIQLYRKVVGSIDLNGLDVLEVGCGRGGGASFIMRYLKPRSMIGVDLSKSAVSFCNSCYSIEGLSFTQGNAESLPFDNNTFDVIINIESSHNYRHIEKFLSEVYRLLRPNGYFLFADFRPKYKVISLREKLINSSLVLLKEEIITPNVIKALELDSERKLRNIDQYVPSSIRKEFKNWAAVKGTLMYELLATGEREYLNFLLQKREA